MPPKQVTHCPHCEEPMQVYDDLPSALAELKRSPDWNERNQAMKSLLLVLLLASAVAAQTSEPPAPKVTGLLLCQRIDPPPPDANPNTTTLSCHHQETRKLGELQPEAFEIPEWYATFTGRDFVMEVLDTGKKRFAEKQPENSEIRYSPPCPKNEHGYQRPPLQRGPCNPELKP